jgi:hypothetical protein
LKASGCNLSKDISKEKEQCLPFFVAAEAESFKRCFMDADNAEANPLSHEMKQAKESSLRYFNLPDEDRLTIEAVLMGKQALDDLPQLKARIVQIFISSTFTGKCVCLRSTWLYSYVIAVGPNGQMQFLIER